MRGPGRGRHGMLAHTLVYTSGTLNRFEQRSSD
jgi:hypothetical protein